MPLPPTIAPWALAEGASVCLALDALQRRGLVEAGITVDRPALEKLAGWAYRSRLRRWVKALKAPWRERRGLRKLLEMQLAADGRLIRGAP